MDTRTNDEWRQQLQNGHPGQATAIADLSAVLLRGALYTLRRTQYDLSRLDGQAVYQLAEDSAQEALLSVLKHIDDFRGESKFTTWAYKFAVNVALVNARHESWKHVSLDGLLERSEAAELPLAGEGQGIDPARAAWQSHVRDVVRDVIQQELTERQRQVLIAMVFEDIPMDEIAQHLGTNRNAIYKLVHDARRKLKERLAARGLLVPEIMDLFART